MSIEEMALKSGYAVGPVWHGSPEAGFTIFRNMEGITGRLGFWFSDSERTAWRFAMGRLIKPNPGVLKVFLRLIHPKTYMAWKDMAEEASRMDDGSDGGEGVGRLRRALMDGGHDGVIMKKSATDRAGERTDYVVFHPNQIKSAEMTTYDDDGMIIPMEMRFNPNSDDIRC